MVHDLIMPKLGLTMTEGVLAEWRVQPGGRFKAGDVLLVVETDKIASEVEAESDGVLVETTVPAGETVPVGTAIGRWSADGTATVPPPPRAAAPAAAPPKPEAPPPAMASAPPASGCAPRRWPAGARRTWASTWRA